MLAFRIAQLGLIYLLIMSYIFSNQFGGVFIGIFYLYLSLIVAIGFLLNNITIVVVRLPISLERSDRYFSSVRIDFGKGAAGYLTDPVYKILEKKNISNHKLQYFVEWMVLLNCLVLNKNPKNYPRYISKTMIFEEVDDTHWQHLADDYNQITKFDYVVTKEMVENAFRCYFEDREKRLSE